MTPVDFAAALMAAAGSTILYIVGGITAGLSIFALLFGAKKGIGAIKSFGK